MKITKLSRYEQLVLIQLKDEANKFKNSWLELNELMSILDLKTSDILLNSPDDFTTFEGIKHAIDEIESQKELIELLPKYANDMLADLKDIGYIIGVDDDDYDDDDNDNGKAE